MKPSTNEKYTPVVQLALTSTSSFVSRTLPFDKEFSERAVRLLIEIQKTGSLKAAARNCSMGYTAAWELIRHMQNALDVKLLNTSTRGGSTLTDEAIELLETYTNLEDYLVRQMMKWWQKQRDQGCQNK